MCEEMGERVEHLLRWTTGEIVPPVKFDIFLTNRCNLRCQFCHYPCLPAHRYWDELADGEVLSLVRQAGEMGAKVFGILGGEPFLRRKLALSSMELAKRYGMAGAIVTNGTLLRNADLRRIIAMGWDLIRFSLDAPDARTHDSLRGVEGCFEKAFGAMGTLQRLKREMDSDSPTVEMNMVLTRQNVSQLSKMMRLAHEQNINRIYILPVIEFGRDISELKIRPSDAQSALEAIREAEEVGKELGVESNLGILKQDKLFTKSNEVDSVLLNHEGRGQHIPCFMPWYGISIDPQGWLTPCGQIETEKRINVRDFPSLSEAWRSSYFAALRTQMAREVLPPGCERCCMPLMDENRILREALQGVDFPGGGRG